MFKYIFLLLFVSYYSIAQIDYQKLKWEFRGPSNLDFGYKNVIDIVQDPNSESKVWACTLLGELLFNNDITNPQSRWEKADLPVGQIYKIKFHPTNPKYVLAINPYNLLKSVDGGNTWMKVQKLLYERSNYDYFTDLQISKKGVIYIRSGNTIYASNNDGVNFNIITASFTADEKIEQMWVQENERLYLLMSNNTGKYADNGYNWVNISLAQLQKEEFPQKIYDEFHGYIVDNGQQYHGYTTVRKNIIVQDRFSTDGGTSYKNFKTPDNTQEVIFVKDELYFATQNGIYKWNSTTNLLEERNSGFMGTENKSFIMRNLSGDNYFMGLNSKGLFVLNENNLATTPIKIQDSKPILSVNNLIVPDNPFGLLLFGVSFENFYGKNTVDAIKIQQITTSRAFVLSAFNQLRLRDIELAPDKQIRNETEVSVLDFIYNSTSDRLTYIDDLGNVVYSRNIQSPTNYDALNKVGIKQNSNIGFASNDVIIEEVSADGSNLIVTDKKSKLYFTLDGRNTWKQINTSAIKDIKINYIEYIIDKQVLVLATETGLYFVENPFSESPKWIKQENLGNEPIIDIKYRKADEVLAVMTRQNGIFSVNLLTQPNQIITNSIDFLSFINHPTFVVSKENPFQSYVCNNGKIKVYFATTIPESSNVNYYVEISEKNGIFPTQPQTLKGSATQSPVEAELNIDSPHSEGYRVRVVSKGGVNAIGTPSTEFYVIEPTTPYQAMNNIGYSYSNNVCVVDSFKVFTDFNTKYSYQWLRDGTKVSNANSYQLFVKDKSKYSVQLIQPNGCVYESKTIKVNSCETTNNSAILLNPPKIVADKTDFYSTEKSVLRSEGCSNVNFQWLKNTQSIINANASQYEVKESGNYTLKIEKNGCVATSSLVKITVENVLNNEPNSDFNVEVYPNPTSDKILIQTLDQQTKPFRVRIDDIYGKLVKEWQFEEEEPQPQIDVKGFQTGTYFLTIFIEKQRIIKKIIIF